MKIGIYGGTFNPIHLGHLHILKEFVRRLSLDRVLLIPTGEPPHKRAPCLAPAEHRLAMCALAAKEISGAVAEVSALEIQRKGKSYTADTLAELRALYPKDELFFLMGEDMFLTVNQWYRPEVICKWASLCASPRSGDGMKKLEAQKRRLEREFSARCFLEDIPYREVSSTQVRELAQKGQDIGGLVPKPVAEYIGTWGLYRKEGRAEAEKEFAALETAVKGQLTEKRFFHSQCVAREAASLAQRYGANVEKARLAGILHDIMKDKTGEEQLKMLKDFGIMLEDAEQENPKLWHAVCGAAYLERRLGITDREVLEAVRCHTSGKKSMTLLEKVLFVADYISADRDYPGVDQLRVTAYQSLEEAIIEGIVFTVGELMEQQKPVAVGSIEAYNDALCARKAKEIEKGSCK